LGAEPVPIELAGAAVAEMLGMRIAS
jgi:hypothetical protein